ncbi:PHD-finger domain-containing protein [Colletotrichum tofieldiae]|uniref:PHD-finger domain-containing protein n=1 Tax=Colletotrichum tofieldiae TaxID=708197 RepID=A0A166QTC1_9PEZI|nr:PHD-finger domain-containing protein [Colletotrichum tofieldiae]GKT61975.1 PHD-finger domain-containing protein [Colletotrichum tofieldiae]GKT69974.1 PHD-finger domain-containing protein [Colletotrichum tofieldiae]GKT92994.1 PHD-finger domain-containing protein [Colletotrichum tofieldiae]
MTEKLQPLSTQTATPSQTLFAPSVPVSTHNVPRKVETVEEEEPYTIKCICNFSDDDGNTIYCDTCDTWQHIDCFYPDSREEALREDFTHSCADCKPRPLDRQKAIERTRRLKNGGTTEGAPDKKVKRPPSKSHKKKPKPTDLQLNGHPAGQENAKHGSPSDHPHPAKKAKTSHRPSHSISSQNAKRSPSYGNSRSQPNGHPPSPATTPPDLPSDFQIHNYSDGFLSMSKEADVPITQINSFASLLVSNTLSVWVREPLRLRKDTGGELNDVFAKLPKDIDSQKRQLHVESKKLPLTSDTVLRWQYLATPAAIEKDVPLIELNGVIGFQKDYCDDPDNLWEELSSPLPFVFFHPMLPLYIDTRKEGSLARFARRSCKPNAILDTYLSGQSEYHFWLVSDRHIAANEQITLPWEFRLPKKFQARMHHLLGVADDDTQAQNESEMDEAEYQTLSGWIHRILSEHGGCACDLGANCAFARFHRQYQAKMQSRPVKKKPRKPKTHTISPTSTGHATNSRAASEGHHDDPDNDARSVSERSKPPSRDRTPLRQGSLDRPGILTEPTDRDKRKVQMVEDSFRRMEQQQPPRKKKRTSDGTGPKTKQRNSTSNASTGTSHYVDAGTSRSKSNSPSSGVSSAGQHPSKAPASQNGSVAAQSSRESSGPRPVYCDASVQTDPVEGEWYSEPVLTPKPRRRIISLSQRLLNNRHRLRCDEVERRKSLPSPSAQEPTPMDVDPPSEHKPVIGSPTPSKESTYTGQMTSPVAASGGDVSMTDVPTSSPSTLKSPAQTDSAADTQVNGSSSPSKTKSPELRVQMPPVPTFNGPVLGTPSATTPSSASTTAQSPFSTGNLPSPFAQSAVNGIAAHPSPVKKKLSLSDYTKSRMNKAKSTGGLKTSLSGAEESKPALDAIMDSPVVEKSTDVLTPVTVNSIPATAATNTSL